MYEGMGENDEMDVEIMMEVCVDDLTYLLVLAEDNEFYIATEKNGTIALEMKLTSDQRCLAVEAFLENIKPYIIERLYN
jgi:hypothetical protein